jgi:pimeloyl-ACP methyl ester carboxylesterase
MSQQGLDHEAREAALAGFDVVATLMREQLPLEQARRPLERAHADYGEIPGLESMFDDPAVWAFLCKIFHYDPAAALSHVTVPLLALFGADDDITPVDASVAGYRRAVCPDLLEVTVFPGADHRLQHGEAPTFVDGYLDSLTAFIRRIVQPG